MNDLKDRFLCAFYALMCPAILVYASTLETRWLVFTLVAMTAVLAILPVRNKKEALLGVVGLSLCVNLDVNFFCVNLPKEYVLTTYGISVGFTPILLVALYMLWILEKRGASVKSESGRFAYIVFCAAVISVQALSFLNTKILSLSLYEFLKQVVAFGFFYYLVNNIDSKRIVKSMLVMLLIGAMLSSFVGIVQYLTGKSLGLGILGESGIFYNQSVVGSSQLIKRVSGLMGHANMFGMYIALILPVAFVLSLSDISRRMRLFAFAATMVCGLGLILSFSRGAIIGFAVALGIILIARKSHLFRAYNRRLVSFYCFLAVTAIVLFGYQIYSRFAASPPDQVSLRFLLNRTAIKMILEHPFFGVGLNNFSIQLATFNSQEIYPWVRYPVHNYYLLVASEAGLLSLAFFVSFLGMVLRLGFRIDKYCQDIFLRDAVLGMSAGLVAILIHCLIDYPLRVSPLYLNFFLFISFIIAIRFNFSRRVHE